MPDNLLNERQAGQGKVVVRPQREGCLEDNAQFARMQLNASGLLVHFRKDIYVIQLDVTMNDKVAQAPTVQSLGHQLLRRELTRDIRANW